MSMSIGASELKLAAAVAEDWLDFKMNPLTQMVPGDPDCDACVLARQYLHLLEVVDIMRKKSRERNVAQGEG